MIADPARVRVRVLAVVAVRAIGIMLASSVVVFTALAVLPGDAVTIRFGGRAAPAELAQLRANAGVDRLAPVRYLRWLGDVVHGDMGTSLSTGDKVATMLSTRLTVSASIVAASLVMIIPLVSALVPLLIRDTGRAHIASTGTATTLAALPEVVVAAVLSALLAGWASVVPPVSLLPRGSSPLAHPDLLLLPALTLAIPSAAYAALLLRGPLLDARRAAHVSDARLRGVSPVQIAVRHVLPSVAAPAIRISGFVIAGLVSGTALVESVFGLSGLGELFVSAVSARDVPIVMAVAMLAASVVVIGMTLADLLAYRGSHPPDLRT